MLWRYWIPEQKPSAIYGDPNNFLGTEAVTDRFGGQIIPITQIWFKLGIGLLPPQEYRASIPEYILGTNILWDLNLQTSVGRVQIEGKMY